MVWKLVKLRGKFNPTINKRKHANLQLVTLPARIGYAKGVAGGASGKRVKACAKCIKAMGKNK